MVIEMVIAKTNPCSLYSYSDNEDLQIKLLKEANEYAKEFNNTPDYKIMTWNEYLTIQREQYLSDPIQEITEERFMEMLEVLPPMKWCTINGVEMFCISEMTCGSFTSQYARKGNKYYSKTVCINEKNTWIHNLI